MSKEGQPKEGFKTYLGVSLAFLVVGVGMHWVTSYYWKNKLEPRLVHEGKMHATILANSQSPILAKAMSSEDEDTVKDALDTAAAEMLLLQDPEAQTPFFKGLKFEANYLSLFVEEGIYDKTWGNDISEDDFGIEVAIYSSDGFDVLGIANFYLNQDFFRKLNFEVRTILGYQSWFGSLFLAVAWAGMILLIRGIHKARHKAEAANLAKSTFLANMSHELRTPLNSIIGFTQIMQRSNDLPTSDLDNLAAISRNGDHLLKLINSVLEMSKIEAGMTKLETGPMDLHVLVESLESMMGVRADRKGLEVIFKFEENVPRYIHTDEGKLRQVLINLIGNAIKFTAEGSITISIQCYVNLETTEATEIPIWFSVKDTGQGISPQEIGHVFEAFRQTDSGVRSKEGTGLGLAISQQFVKLLGGEIDLESEVGKGTTFKFKILAVISDSKDMAPEEDTRKVLSIAPGQTAEDGSSFRILIVDDIKDNRTLLRKTLEQLGFEVDEAENGQVAVDKYKSWAPQLIWMDLRMPVMDGYTATGVIKADAREKGSKIVVIALTAHAFEEERAEALSHGCDDFIRKPFQERDIYDALHNHLGIQFVHEGDDEPEQEEDDKSNNGATSFKDSVGEVPPELISNLREATELGDMMAIDEALAKIREVNGTVADEFEKYTSSFAYDDLLRVIDEIS